MYHRMATVKRKEKIDTQILVYWLTASFFFSYIGQHP